MTSGLLAWDTEQESKRERACGKVHTHSINQEKIQEEEVKGWEWGEIKHQSHVESNVFTWLAITSTGKQWPEWCRTQGRQRAAKS